jgi:S1-C subfamily serine protease
LQTSTEAKIRKLFPEEIGMLVAETIIPKGPAAEHMEEGDVLLTINGEYITKFGPFESVLDSNVKQDVVLGIERGGEYKEFTLRVGDLHAM